MDNPRKTFVLVHGAWHGAWSFKKTKKKMEAAGAKVVCSDLPGHGTYKAKIKEVTLDSYVQKVKAEILELDERVVLVGHSLAGFIVSQLVEEIPEKIEKLVFIASMIPYDGKSVFDIINNDTESQLLQNLIFAEDKSWVTVNEETLKNVVYNRASVEQITEAVPNLVHQATQPFFATVNANSEAFNTIDKTYIICEYDKIFSPKAQRDLVQTIGITKTISLNTGHVPQVENPEELAKSILNA